MNQRKIKISTFLILVLSLHIVLFQAVTIDNEPKPIMSITEAKNVVEKRLKSEAQTIREINASSVLSQLRSTGKFTLSLNNEEITFNLNEKKYDCDFSEEIYFFNGFIEGYENSEAYLTLDNYRISGRIELPTKDRGIQSYSISHISDYINPKINENSPIHIVRNLNGIKNTGYDHKTNKFIESTNDDFKNLQNNCDCNCSTSSGNKQENEQIPKVHDKLSIISTSSYYAKVKIFADYYYYSEYGDTNWYFMDEVNYVIGRWDNTGQQNPDMQISVKSTDIWTSTSEGGSCYSATSMSDLHSKFSSWGNSENIFGTWYSGYYGAYWTGDTDFTLLMTGKNWATYLGMANYDGAGIYKSGTSKYSICEIWPGLLTEIVSWGISHEWGHLFSGDHEEASGGSWGHRAWSWCDLGYFFGICLGYRQTNMWHRYNFGQSSIGVFSKSGTDGASSADNNIYYIRQWRNTYLRS